MTYIVINNENLKLSFSEYEESQSFSIPTKKSLMKYLNDFERLVFEEVILPYEQKYTGSTYTNISPCIAGLEPWLLAVASIMWEGMIQGLTWDAIKLSVLDGIKLLRKHDLAPPSQETEENFEETKKSEFKGFS